MKNIKTPLLDGLIKYKDEGILRFHMPGHYGNGKFTKILSEKLFDIDVTEVNGTDNLAEPNGIIKKSLENIAEIFCTKKSYYLVNGSTSGLYVAIDSLTEYGDEIIIARNSHKSVYNICKRKKLDINFVYPQIDENFGVDKEITLEDIKLAVEQSEAKVVVLTYPNYYGRAFDIEKIYRYLKSKNIYLIIDSAHGSTFAFSDDLPEVATKYSDICIHSLHKTLPAFTQISLLSINESVDSKKIEENIRFYQTTSPSYILMTSGEVAIATMQENKGELTRIKNAFEKAASKLEKNPRIKVYNSKKQDFGKLFVKSDLDGAKLNDILRKEYNIQSEMVIGNCILFMLGITHSDGDIEYLVNSIIKVVESQKKSEEQKVISLLPKAEMYTKFYGRNKRLLEILGMESENKELEYKENGKINNAKLYGLTGISKGEIINFKKEVIIVDTVEAENLISAEDIVPYPPGIPVLLEGEIINREIIEMLLYLGIDKVKIFEILV